ncbi:two-component regulator propeller domain-containing protein [Candidatus Halobeggiatoa sp. HSG11]|nr:two-component regulator propeller domain-containing protein [Candidatus Halobeggiatoa sp. HSG11]
MKKSLKLILLNIFISIIISAQAAASKYSDVIQFDKIEVDTIINTFIQDKDGFFWIGGDDGLYKFDGYSFKHYTPGPGSIAGNGVGVIYEDSRGLLWIGSASGLSVYDKSTDIFTTYLHDPDDSTSISSDNIATTRLQAIVEDADNMIWIGTGNGLNKFDRASQTFTRYQESFISNDIWNLYLDAEQFLWVGTANGLHKFDPRSKTVLERYETDNNDPDSLHGSYIKTISQDREGILWVGTENSLNRLAKGRFTHYRHDPNNENSLSSDQVTSIMVDMNDILWLTTVDGGLNLFDKKTEIFTHYRYAPDNSDSISGNYLTNVHQDALGVVWLSGYGGVLHRVDPESVKFQAYVHNPKNSNSLGKGSYYGHSIEDREGMIWIAVAEDGLDRFDRETGIFTHYRHDPNDSDSLPESYGQSVIEDKDGNLWVTTSNKIVLFDKKTGKVKQTYLASNWPSGPVEDSTNPDVIWWGTWGSGLLKFNKSDGKITYLTPSSVNPTETVSNTQITYIYQDNTGIVWLCTRGSGVDKFDPRTEKVVAKYKHIPTDLDTISSNMVYHVYKDSADRYWMMTDKGLDQFDPKTEKFKRLNQQNGLFPLSSASQAIEDNQGHLWIAGYGAGTLVRFEPDSGKYRVYTIDDGIVLGLATTYSAMRAKDGTLWFFGRTGINTFRPEQIKDNLYQPPVFLTSLTQGGEPIKTGKAPELTTEIQLDWQHNFFEFEAAALNYRHAEHNQYRYKLEGVDHEWFEAGKIRQSRYTGLAAGEYTLKIQGSNNDGLWSEKIAELKVVVTPPWWQTIWFQGFIFALFIGFGVGGYRWRLYSIKAHNRELETQVSKRTIELRESQRAMRTLVSNLPGMAYRCRNDSDWTMEFISDACLGLTGYSATIITNGAEINYADIIHRNDQESVWQFVQQALQNKQPFELSYRIITKTGQLKWVWEQGQGVFDQNGKLLAIEGLINDITEQKQTEMALQQAKKDAETANQAKSTFLSSMSHELRTPLNSILGFAQILQRDTSITIKQQHDLNIIEQSGNHLLSLINDVLDLAKVESGKIELFETDFSLPSLLNEIGELIKVRTQHENINFHLKFADELPNGVCGDERRLRQILLNLLTNAVKFTKQGSVSLEVKSEKLTVKNGESEKQSLLHFLIQDTGVGIFPENLETIFEPFKQVGEQEFQAEGTGLGLAISKNLVELMGGQLHVSSQVNVGTQFWFELALPVVDYNVTPIVQQSIIGIQEKPPKILVVDDNLNNRVVLIDMLAPLGFLVESANNGRIGIEIAIKWKPDVIITDLIMPDMDGFELIRQLRQSPLLKEKIIIAASASVYEEDKKRSLTIGSNAFLPKPIKIEKLLEQLQHHLNLTWVYGDKIPEMIIKNDASNIVLPPTTELEKLYGLSLMGNVNKLEEQVAILGDSVELEPFVTQMQVFLKNYQLKKLLKWLEEKMKNDY